MIYPKNTSLDLGTLLFQELNRFVESKFQRWVRPSQILKGVLPFHSFDLTSAVFVQTGEDVIEGLVDHVQNFLVRFLKRHLQIQTGELTHVSVSKGILTTEHGPDFKHALHVAHQSHLLVQLRRLLEVLVGKVIFLEVGHLENFLTAL